MLRTSLLFAATAALLSAAAPASAAFIGDNVFIQRFHGTTPVFAPVVTAVGAGLEYEDNFFAIDITGNEVIFDAVSGFSIGDVAYEISGLDFDDVPSTPNVIQGFASSQITGPGATPIDLSRVTISPGAIRMSFRQTTGSSSGFARITFGPADAAVPEPATWAMMIGGFGAVGGAMRRRKAPAPALV